MNMCFRKWNGAARYGVVFLWGALTLGCATSMTTPNDATSGDAALPDSTPRDAAPPDADATLPDAMVDAALDAGPTAPICQACEDDAECGTGARCVPFSDGTQGCLPMCNPDLPDCPTGFDCILNFSAGGAPVCTPVGRACCHDEDSDTYGSGVGCMGPDCDDDDPEVHPGALEVCDGDDEDCDPAIDEGIADLECGTGVCAATVPACDMGMLNVCEPGPSSDETCNRMDDDCDTRIDEAIPELECGMGECRRTAVACSDGVPGVCTPGMSATEICNGADDDCDGPTDEEIPDLVCGRGECRRTAVACTGGVAGMCTPGTPTAEVCNGRDDDCNGTADDIGTTNTDNFNDGRLQGWTDMSRGGYRLTNTGTYLRVSSPVSSYYSSSGADGQFYKDFDIAPGQLRLSLRWRATSTTATSSVTNSRMWIQHPSTGAVLCSRAFVSGGTRDTGWRTYSEDLGSCVTGLRRVRITFWMRDAWRNHYYQTQYFDDIEVRSTCP